MSRRRPREEEWDFDDVIPGEEKTGCFWDYGCELPELRKPGALDMLPQTREVEWLRKLNFIFGKAFLKESCFLTKPWIIASREWHEQLPNFIERELEQYRQIFEIPGIKPNPRPVDAPIELHDPLAAAIVLRAVLDPDSDSDLIPMEITGTASKKDIFKEVGKIVDAHALRRGKNRENRGKDKMSDWKDKWDALGIMRLKQYYSVSKIVQLLKAQREARGEHIEDESLEHKVRFRAKQTVQRTFTLVYPSFPLPKRFR